jgi:hypothetical protein
MGSRFFHKIEDDERFDSDVIWKVEEELLCPLPCPSARTVMVDFWSILFTYAIWIQVS